MNTIDVGLYPADDILLACILSMSKELCNAMNIHKL